MNLYRLYKTNFSHFSPSKIYRIKILQVLSDTEFIMEFEGKRILARLQKPLPARLTSASYIFLKFVGIKNGKYVFEYASHNQNNIEFISKKILDLLVSFSRSPVFMEDFSHSYFGFLKHFFPEALNFSSIYFFSYRFYYEKKLFSKLSNKSLLVSNRQKKAFQKLYKEIYEFIEGINNEFNMLDFWDYGVCKLQDELFLPYFLFKNTKGHNLFIIYLQKLNLLIKVYYVLYSYSQDFLADIFLEGDNDLAEKLFSNFSSILPNNVRLHKEKDSFFVGFFSSDKKGIFESKV
jgi:hypothetical protein